MLVTVDTRELIQAELGRMSDEQLDELYVIVKQMISAHQRTSFKSIYDALEDIRIQGPEDLSTNFERYMGRDTDDGPDLC